MSFSNTKTKRKKKEPTTRQLCSRCDSIVTLRMWDITSLLIAVGWLALGVSAPWLSLGDGVQCTGNPWLLVICGWGIVTFVVGTVTTACGFHQHRLWSVLISGALGVTLVISGVPLHHSVACGESSMAWQTELGLAVRAMYVGGGSMVLIAGWQNLRRHDVSCRHCGGLRLGRLI